MPVAEDTAAQFDAYLGFRRGVTGDSHSNGNGHENAALEPSGDDDAQVSLAEACEEEPLSEFLVAKIGAVVACAAVGALALWLGAGDHLTKWLMGGVAFVWFVGWTIYYDARDAE